MNESAKCDFCGKWIAAKISNLSSVIIIEKKDTCKCPQNEEKRSGTVCY